MRSFTSSSDRTSAPLRWGWLFGLAFVLVIGVIVAMEVVLASRGYSRTVQDSEALWLRERLRASNLGKDALILVGASRIQLGLDMDRLREHTGLTPVQLAIDGSGFEAVLASLAADPAVNGTVIVDYYAPGLGNFGGIGATYAQKYSSGRSNPLTAPYAAIEASLSGKVRNRLRAYGDGASPLNSLLFRILSSYSAQAYLNTLPDRSRIADYSRVHMPDFYHDRVARHLGMPHSDSLVPLSVLQEKMRVLEPQDNTGFLAQARRLRQTIGVIEARGGRVLFVAMPTSGMIREIDDRLYPRVRFWDPFVREVGVVSVQASDLPELKGLVCPDGSHVDMRDRERVTLALVRALGLAK